MNKEYTKTEWRHHICWHVQTPLPHENTDITTSLHLDRLYCSLDMPYRSLDILYCSLDRLYCSLDISNVP